MKLYFIGPKTEEKSSALNTFKVNFNKIEFIDLEDAKSCVDVLSDNAETSIILIDIHTFSSLEDSTETYQQLRVTNPDHVFFLIGRKHALQNIVPTHFFSDTTPNDTIDFPINIKVCRKSIEQAIGYIEHREMERISVVLNKDDFFPVKINNFYEFDQAVSDVYMHLENEKFVKVLEKETPYHSSHIYKIQIQGVKHLYLEKNEYLTFLHRSSNKLIKEMSSQSYTPQNMIKTQLRATLMVQEMLRAVGVNETITELIKKLLSSSSHVFSNVKSIVKIMSYFPFSSPSLMERSLLMNYVGIALLTKHDWTSDTSKGIIGISAFIHDYYVESEELSAMTIFDWAKKKETLEPQAFQNYMDHPERAYRMAKLLRGLPDASFVVHEHHEYPAEFGFPKKLYPMQVNPLSAMFIIINYFVNEIYKRGVETRSIYLTLKDIKVKFSEGRFKKVADNFENIFSK